MDERVGLGVYTIDTGFHRSHFDAAYLLVDSGEAAFIDSGINASVPAMLDTLTNAGLTVSDVRYVVLTHVHLDHAGGAGLLMRHLPSAELLVHPRGERHMIDPTALVAGASAVYGADVVQKTYGDLVPIPAARIRQACDAECISLGRRTLQVFDAPGHARHHIVLHDPLAEAFFTGDTFGLSYREFDTRNGAWAMPTTTPVQFDPEALKASIRRMLSLHPRRMYLTHYGCVEEPERLAEELLQQIDSMVRIASAAHENVPAANRHALICDGLSRLYLERLRAHGVTLSEQIQRELLAMDVELNAQGLGTWLDRNAPS